MKVSDRLIDVLRRDWEGCRLTLYKCPGGFPTIGIGHKLTQDELTSGKITIAGEKIRYAGGISLQQALDLCRQDLRSAEYAVNMAVKVPLEQHQFDTLCSFAFNVGVNAFHDSTLLKRLNLGKYDEVPAQLRRWMYSGGERSNGLENRREKEIAYWEVG